MQCTFSVFEIDFLEIFLKNLSWFNFLPLEMDFQMELDFDLALHYTV